MSDQYGKLGLVLEEVKIRLIQQVYEATEDTVKITNDPSYRITASDIFQFNITPSPQARVDQAAYDGGANFQLSVRTRVIVTVFMPNAVDNPRESDQFHTADKSIHYAKVAVLKALSNWNPFNNNTSQFLLNDPMIPAEWQFTKDKSSGDIQIAFDVEYDEDLDLEDV